MRKFDSDIRVNKNANNKIWLSVVGFFFFIYKQTMKKLFCVSIFIIVSKFATKMSKFRS